VESSAQIRLPAHLRFDASYTRLYTRVVSTTSFFEQVGDELARRPRNSGAVTLSWTPRRWSFIAGARFVGDRQDPDFVFYTINRNPGYENVYAGGAFDLTKHVTPVIRLDNLLNERYEEVLGYTALSRSIIGGLRIRW